MFDEILDQMSELVEALAKKETVTQRQLRRVSRILFVLTTASCVAAVTGLALVVLRLCG